MPIATGTRLGPYVVQEPIGQGAMGVVYRAYHAQLERTGAVKVMQALTPDEATTARFRREAQAIAHMRHPNVLNVFDFGEFEGTPYMIVEYVEGGSLLARLKRAPLTPAQALGYLRGVAAALDYAHSLGIVHRDVKPANVLLGPNDAPILADFGLAKLMQSSSIKSITGVTTGTPAYMAPEQVTGEEVGPAADRYSLAVMAFEMLTGTLPFDEAGVLEVLYAHVHRQPPTASARQPLLPNRVDAVVMRGLEKNPDARWQSCAAFVDALESSLDGGAAGAVGLQPVATLPASNGATAVMALPAPPVAATAVPPAQNPKRRRRPAILWIAAALILLLVLGTTALLVANRPTLRINPPQVQAGGRVTVLATHVPRGQVGEIQLHSELQLYPFQADGNGDVVRDIVVPADTPPGVHTVSVCWSGSCHASQTLMVLGAVAQASPGTSPTPATTPTPTPTSGRSPGPTPGRSPSPHPTSNPTSHPTAVPSPTPLCSTGSPALTGPGSVIGGANALITGTNFVPGNVTWSYYAGTTLVSTQTTVANSSCAVSFTVKTSVAVLPRTDRVVAKDRLGRQTFVTFTALV